MKLFFSSSIRSRRCRLIMCFLTLMSIIAIHGQSQSTSAVTLTVKNLPNEFEDSQIFVFETLFGIAYDPSEITYFMDDAAAVNGLYTGRNHFGQVFDFEVIVASPVDLTTITGYSQQFLDEAAQLGFEMNGVVGVMSVGNIRVPITGLAYSRSVPSTPGFDARLLVLTDEDPNGFLFQLPPPHQEDEVFQIELPVFTSTRFLTYLEPCSGPIPLQPGNFSWVDWCWALYNAALRLAFETFDAAEEVAQEIFDAEVIIAEGVRDASISVANTIRNDTINVLGDEFRSEIGICPRVIHNELADCDAIASVLAFFESTGLELTLCLRKAISSYKHCKNSAFSHLQSGIDRADATYDFDIQNAMFTFDLTVEAASQDYETSVNEALDDLDDDLDAAQAAYSDCLAACPPVPTGCGEVVQISAETLIRLARRN